MHTKRNEHITIFEISELSVDGLETLVIYPEKSNSKYDAYTGCDELLSAWDNLKLYMDDQNINDVWLRTAI